MSTFNRTCLVLLMSLLACSEAWTEPPDLGRTPTQSQLADITIMPNGTGLPDGSGSVATGADLYQRHCLACHGERGTGGSNDALAGGHGTLATSQPQKTVGSFWPYATTLFDYVRRAMPYPTPGSLTDNEVYAVTAYILFINGIIDEDTELDATSLAGVKMPNGDNFRPAYRAR